MFFFKKKKTKDILYYFEQSLELLYPKIDPKYYKDYTELPYLNKIKFRTPANFTIEEMNEMVPLKSLRLFIKELRGESLWEAEYDEYKLIYEDTIVGDTIKKILEPSLFLLKEHKNDIFYQHLILKYELSIVTVFQTLTDSIEINDEITKSLEKSSMQILGKFAAAIFRCEKERKEYIKRDIQSFNKSLNERLKLENEYLTRFVDIKK
jgi:hypothetical protein